MGRSFVFYFLLLILTSLVSAQTVTFELIPGAISANDMSPDGRFIVGETSQRPYLLDTTTGTMTLLPALGLDAVAVSDDGTYVLGDIPDPEGEGSNVAARWSQATGWVSLGHLPNAGGCPSRSDGYELSADGEVAVGLSWEGCSGRGFYWTQKTGMLELQNLANGNNRASVVSADGTVIGGFAQGSFSRTPAVWDNKLNGQLLDPPNGDALGEIHGLRDDGSILLGEWLDPDDPGYTRATKWTWNGISWDRQQIAGGSIITGWSGIPTDIADDQTIVGFDILLTNRRAWIQYQGKGQLQLLKMWANDRGANIPDEQQLQVCQAISADGKCLIGHGYLTGAWILKIQTETTVTAQQMTVYRGVQIAGTLEDTFESDDSRVLFNPGFTLNSSEAPVWLIFDGVLPSDSPSTLNLILESQAGTPGLTGTIEAWNWQTDSYEVVDVTEASFNSDDILNIDLTPEIAQYVQSGTGAVRSRVGWRKTGFVLNYPWEVRVDQFVWSVN